MNGLKYWYQTRSNNSKKAISILGVALCVVVVGIIGYPLLAPQKVDVSYGTIVRDPVDGHVWEDHTKTIRVDADKAGKYTVEYVDKLSTEHQQQAAQEKTQEAETATQAASTQIIEPASPMMTDAQMANMRTAQQSVDTIGQSIINGMKMLNGFAQTRTQMINYRNQIAAMPVAPEIEPLKQQLLQIFDKYIQASDLYIQAMVTGDTSRAAQANSLISEANGMVQNILPGAQALKNVIDEFINILRTIFPSSP